MTKFYNTAKRRWLLFLLLSFLPGKLYAQVYANSQTNGATGICLLCGVSNPDNPINNGNLNDYSTFNITVGLLGVTVYQTLIFPAASTTGCDSLIIGIGSGNTALSVNLLAGLTVQTFNGSVVNNDAQTVDSTHLRLQGNSRGEIILRPVHTFDRVKITLSSSLIGLLNAFHLYYAYHKPATPTPMLTDSTAVCAGDSITLSATGISGAIISWYNSSSGGTLLHTGNTYRVSPASSTTYYAAAAVGGCTSARKAVVVIVNPKPANPVYTVPQGRVCGNVNIAVTNYQPGINYQVRVRYTGSGNLNIDTSYSVISSNIIPVRDLAYYFNATAAVAIQAVNTLTGCRSDSVKMTFIFGGHAAPVKVTGDSVVICKGDSAILNANLFNDPGGVNLALIRWYDAPTGGNLLYTGHNLKVKPATTTTYYVTAAFECDYPVRTPAKVVVRKLPAPVYTVPQGVACGIQYLPVLNYQVGYSYSVRSVYRSFQGTLADTSYLISNSNTIITPAIFPRIPVDVDVFVQAIDSISGCRSDTIHMIYSMGGATALPAVDNDRVNICHGDTALLRVFVPGLPDATIRFKWYDTPTGGNLLFSGNYFRVSPDTTTAYYAASGYECEFPQRARVVVTVNDCFNNRMAVPASVSQRHAAINISLSPNPTKGWMRLTTDKDLTGSQVIIYDINGKEIQREVLQSNSFYLKNSRMSPGMYLVKIVPPKSGDTYIQRIIYQP